MRVNKKEKKDKQNRENRRIKGVNLGETVKKAHSMKERKQRGKRRWIENNERKEGRW